MNTAATFLNQVSPAWWHYTAHATWQAALATALLLGVVAWGRKWPAPWRYGLLLVALLKFAVPPFLPAPSGAFSRLGPRVAAVSPAVHENWPAYLPEPGPACAGASGAAARDAEMARTPRWEESARQTPLARVPAQPVRRPALRWTVWLMLVHLVGGSAVLLCIAGQLALLHRAVGVSRPVSDGPLRLTLRALAAELGLRRVPALKISSRITSPVAFGVLRPTIPLPATNLSRLSEGELRVILAHELAHFRRRDLRVNWAQILLQAVWWFNPLLWMLNRALRKAREDCCDDLLLARNLTSKGQYCDTLMRAAVEFRPQQPAAGALGFGERLHPLGRRFARIMDGPLPRAYRLSALGFVVMLGVGFLLLPGLRSQTAVPEQPGAGSTRPPELALDRLFAQLKIDDQHRERSQERLRQQFKGHRQEAVAFLTNQLASAGPSEDRLKAAWLLCQLGGTVPQAAIQALIRAPEDKDRAVSRWAASALGQPGSSGLDEGLEIPECGPRRGAGQDPAGV